MTELSFLEFDPPLTELCKPRLPVLNVAVPAWFVFVLLINKDTAPLCELG